MGPRSQTWLHTGAGDLNSRPCACTANALPTEQLPSSRLPFGGEFSLAWGSPSILGWLATEPQGYTSLCLPGDGNRSGQDHHSAWFLKLVLGIELKS